MKKIQQCIITIALISMLSACNNDKPANNGVFAKINKNEKPVVNSKKNDKADEAKKDNGNKIKEKINKKKNSTTVPMKNKNIKKENSHKQVDLNPIQDASNSQKKPIKENINSNFNIQIDENDTELVAIINTLEEQYNKEKQIALDFYSTKMTELDNNFIKQLNDAKNNLNNVSSKFNSECKIFTTSNIEQCNKMKNIIDDSTNVVAKGDFEIKNILSGMKKNKHKELTSLEVEFQKSVLDAKNEYVFSKE